MSKDFHVAVNRLFENYYDERMKLYPLEATQNGDYALQQYSSE
jgi:hypothetical protein